MDAFPQTEASEIRRIRVRNSRIEYGKGGVAGRAVASSPAILTNIVSALGNYNRLYKFILYRKYNGRGSLFSREAHGCPPSKIGILRDAYGLG